MEEMSVLIARSQAGERNAREVLIENNLGLADTKLDVHCITGESRGKMAYPLKKNVKLTNTCALVIRDFPDGVEIIGE